jgi:hypothetical protein
VVKNDAGSRSRGYKLATLRTLLDHAGLLTQVGLGPIQVHDLPFCRLFFETASVLRAGDVLLEDRGFVDGIVKLLGMIVSPGNSRHFPGAIATDPTLRPPAPCP